MKKLFYSFMALSLLLCACDKDEKDQDNIRHFDAQNVPETGMMLDAACITKLQLFCMETEVLFLSGFNIPAMYNNNYTRKQKEPLFANYSSVKMYAVFDKNGNGFANDSAQVARTINDLVFDWYCRRTDFILEQYNKEVSYENPIEWPTFFTSYVNGDVQLTCDKVLFGQQPGENLNKHFMVTPPYYFLPVGRETPNVQYGFTDSDQLRAGVRMPDFFTNDSWMQFSYLIRFIDEPTERYDEITFTMTFPASLEHVREFVTSKYKGENAPMRVTDTTFTASFKAKFKWE